MSNFNQLQAKRRSIYALGKELPVSNDALVEIVGSTICFQLSI